MENEVIKDSRFPSEFVEIKSEVLEVQDIKVEEEELDMNLNTEQVGVENKDVFSVIAQNEENWDRPSSSSTKQKIASRARIVGMRESGLSISNIAKKLGICRQTVAKWIKRWEEEQNLRDRSRPGQPRKTTAEEDHRIIAAVGENPFTNAPQIVEHLQLNVSPLTVRRRLHEQKNGCSAFPVEEKLTENHRNSRLNFANDFKDEDMDFWARVIFPDEKTFCFHDDGNIRCWGRNNTRYAFENICKGAKSEHVTCNFWGWMHLQGVGELTQIFGRLTSDQYIEILEEVMLPSVRAMAIPYPDRIMFMHDADPVHTSRAVTSWFQDHPEIELINWPAQGWDLNPIEDVWKSMVKEWKQPDVRTIEVLKQQTFRVWESLRRKPEIIADYVRSVPHRLQKVIDQDGGWTNC